MKEGFLSRRSAMGSQCSNLRLFLSIGHTPKDDGREKGCSLLPFGVGRRIRRAPSFMKNGSRLGRCRQAEAWRAAGFTD